MPSFGFGRPLPARQAPEERIEGHREEERMRRQLLRVLGLGVALAGFATVVDAAEATPRTQTPASSPQSGPQAPAEAGEEQQVTRQEEVTVESASKVEQKLVDAPATMSVVTSEALATQPAQNMADTLRSVPGLNVIQMSARDINITARQATSTLATSQLVSVDGRSVYLDFFGLVLWDLVPSPTSGEIKQIEVVRGPASVVWGANAVNGVVNIITKTPRENEGFGVVLGAGLFDRDGGTREADGSGYQFNGSFSYANAINDTGPVLTAGRRADPRAARRPGGSRAAQLPPLRRRPLS
jgi:outer membrane receptor protein involved in Fe transport